MKKLFVIGIAMLSCGWVGAQTTLNIDTCYARAEQNYPLVKQHDLIEKSRDYNVSNAKKAYLPQVSINGKATYQSAVTSIDFTLPPAFGGQSFPVPSKDQYNFYGEVTQTIYDGGITKDQEKMQNAKADIQQQSLKVQLYNLKARINQVYFGTLMIDAQIKQNGLLQKDIQSSIDKVQSAVTNGTVLQSNLDELDAALLQQQQNEIQLKAARKSYLDMLGLFINQKLDENTVLKTPAVVVVKDSITRPELAFYDVQKKTYDIQNSMITAKNLPKVSFFFQGGYGKPGLNAFDTQFDPYYIGGLRFTWPLSGFYTAKQDRQLLDIDKQSLDVQKSTFLFNTKLSLQQQNEDIVKLQQMISKDKDIIKKRTAVKNAAKSQMDNGVITTHYYISDLNAEELAKQSLALHQIQLLMTEYNHKDTTGN